MKSDLDEHQREGEKGDEHREQQGGQFELEMRTVVVQRYEEGGQGQYDGRIVRQVDQIEVEGRLALQIDEDVEKWRIAFLVHHLRFA